MEDPLPKGGLLLVDVPLMPSILANPSMLGEITCKGIGWAKPGWGTSLGGNPAVLLPPMIAGEGGFKGEYSLALAESVRDEERAISEMESGPLLLLISPTRGLVAWESARLDGVKTGAAGEGVKAGARAVISREELSSAKDVLTPLLLLMEGFIPNPFPKVLVPEDPSTGTDGGLCSTVITLLLLIFNDPACDLLEFLLKNGCAAENRG